MREIDPLSLPEFRHNRLERCYACKRAIITRAWEIAAARGHSVLWDGTNLDDLADFRPGHGASGNWESEARLATGMGKAAIRALSRGLGLDPRGPPRVALPPVFPMTPN